VLTSVIELTSDELKPPSIWSELTPGATASPKRRLDGKKKSRKGNSVTKGKNKEPKMMWDFETEMWVENTMGSHVPASFSPIKPKPKLNQPNAKRKSKGKKPAKKKRKTKKKR